jgi:anti-sigma-K factor RskA
VRVHDWFVEHRAEYATGILDADDSATFQAHLVNCEECRREIARIERELAWLPMNLPPAAPRPGLKRRIIRFVLDDARAPARRWYLPALAAAASVLIALGGWTAGRQQAAKMEAEVAALRGRAMALADTLSIIRRAGRVLQANVDVDGRTGGLVIFADETTHRWNVVVHGLPPAPAGKGYQFWFICADGMVRSANLVGGTGSTMFTTGMPETGGAVLGAALTMEPLGTANGPPQGKELAHLML